METRDVIKTVRISEKTYEALLRESEASGIPFSTLMAEYIQAGVREDARRRDRILHFLRKVAAT